MCCVVFCVNITIYTTQTGGLFIPPRVKVCQNTLKDLTLIIYIMSRIRSFSIVFHNVKDDAKSSVENHFKSNNPKEILVSMEPYPESEGHHIHVFVCFKNAHFFTKMLESCILLSTKLVAPRPDDITGDWGRVQVDKMRGTFKEATAYLTNPVKDKECDPEVTHHKADVISCDICGCQAPAILMRCQFADDMTVGRCHKCHLRRLTPPCRPRLALDVWER